MENQQLFERISALAQPLATSLGLAIWGIEVAFGPRSLVRVYVDRHDGTAVDIDECAELSRIIGLSLDVEDCMPAAYTLEVSSPGLERIFFTAEQLAGALGKTVEVQLRMPVPAFPKRRKFRGVLVKAEGEEFGLQVEDSPQEELLFGFGQTKKVFLVHVFPEKELPGKGKSKKKVQSTAETDTADAKHPAPAGDGAGDLIVS